MKSSLELKTQIQILELELKEYKAANNAIIDEMLKKIEMLENVIKKLDISKKN